MSFEDMDELDRQLITIQDLVYSGHDGITPQLIAFLDSTQPRACWAATWALDRCWDDRACEPVARTIARVDIHAPVLAHIRGPRCCMACWNCWITSLTTGTSTGRPTALPRP
jgi:hypothetical protein